MFLWFCFALLAINFGDCARIFGFFPTPSISHQIVYHSLVKELGARGHQLTILTTDLMETDNPNITQIDLHGSYKTAWQELNLVTMKQDKLNEEGLVKVLLTIHSKVLDWQLSQPEVKSFIENTSGQKFDVLIIEMMCKSVALAFGEAFNAPIIGINSADAVTMNHEIMGNEINPAVHPELHIPYFHGKLSFKQRANSLMFYLKTQLIYKPLVYKLNNELLQKHFPAVKDSIDELESRVHLLMTNTNPALDFNRPLTPNTIQLGFMHIEPAKLLPQGELKSFLDNSKNGIIYMSLGSNAKSKDLKPEIVKMFLEAFASLDYDFLWKFEAETLADKPDNVMIRKWFPQADVLAHRNVKLFITHGGQQSMEEAIDRTIPMIVFPLLGDQNVNALRMVVKKIGFRLDLLTLTEIKLLEAINEMVKPEYKSNIEKLRLQVYDQPMTSRERVVWWTEFVIRNKGADNLKYSGRLVPFYQKFWLDFLGIGVVFVLFSGSLICFLTKKLCARQKFKSD